MLHPVSTTSPFWLEAGVLLLCSSARRVRVRGRGAVVVRALLAVFCAFAVSAWGQSDPKTSVAFRADTTLVLVPVSVTDPSNRYVLGLEKQDFHLFEDDAAQT